MSSAWLWPDKIRAKSLIYRTAIIRFGNAGGRIIKGMVGRRQAVRLIPHEVRHDRPYAAFLVIQHDRRATGRACAKLQRTIRVIRVKRLTIQAVGFVNAQVAVLEKHHMRGVLTGNTFANRTVAGVVVDWILVRVGVYVVAPSSIFMRHDFLLVEFSCFNRPGSELAVGKHRYDRPNFRVQARIITFRGWMPFTAVTV